MTVASSDQNLSKSLSVPLYFSAALLLTIYSEYKFTHFLFIAVKLPEAIINNNQLHISSTILHIKSVKKLPAQLNFQYNRNINVTVFSHQNT